MTPFIVERCGMMTNLLPRRSRGTWTSLRVLSQDTVEAFAS